MESILQPITNYIMANSVDSVTIGFIMALGCWFMGFAVSSMVRAFTITCDVVD